MTRRWILAATATLLLSPLAGAQSTFTIYWNQDHLYDAYQEVFDAFAEEHGLTLDVQVFAWPDLQTRLLADFSAGTVPDLIEVPAPWTVDYGGMGQLVDLTERLEAWPDRDEWFEGAWPEVTLEGSIYGVKLHHTAFGFFYNRELLEQAGLEPRAPETLEEFRTYAETTYEALGPNVLAFGFDADPFYLTPFISTENTPQLVQDGEIAIDTPEVVEALEILQEVAGNDWALLPEPGASYQSSRRAFIDGQTAMMISGPWDIAGLADVAPDLDYGIGPIPVLEGLTSRPPAAGVAVAIPTAASQQDLSWELIDRLTEVEVQVAATLEAGMLFPRRSWAEHPEVQGLERVSDFLPMVANATPFDLEARQAGVPEIVGTGEVFTEFYQTLIYGRLPAAEALAAYVEEANALLGRAAR